MFPTLAERKAQEREMRASQIAAICDELRAYASAHGGRYLLYGSAARGATGEDSDIDLLTDFPADREAKAWRFAEARCAARGVPFDIKPLSWCEARFVSRISAYWRVLA